MIGNRVGPVRAAPHWDACRRLARDSAVDVEPLARSQAADEPFDADVALTPAAIATTHPLEASIRAILAELEEVVRLDPTHHDARLQLAGTYLLLFECAQHGSAANAMPLSAIREAAIAAQFTSRAELNAWLRKAVGEHADYLEQARRHTRIALRQCPLEGAGYLYLGELRFLEGVASREAIGEGVAQALRTRPHHGGVLLSAGQEAVMAGSLDRAVEYWQRAYRLGPAYRKVLVRQLAGQVCPGDPAADVDFFLDTFDPDLAVVRQLEAFHGERSEAAELVRLRERHAKLARDEAQRCDDPAAACRLWMEARLAHERLARPAEALDCLREAARSDPNNAAARRRLAANLLDAKRFDEAETHLKWCAARTPDDPGLRTALRKCAQGRLALERK
ncbi:MAG TPA: hypothetical protein DD670_14730 [Planctomycetaceae bacterium]|nr:hypothetical protein [Planctomycetaceae bacterium]